MEFSIMARHAGELDAGGPGRPCVINAMIQDGADVLAAPFRRDALSHPVRYLEKYHHLKG